MPQGAKYTPLFLLISFLVAGRWLYFKFFSNSVSTSPAQVNSYTLANSHTNQPMEVSGFIVLREGWNNGMEWIVNDDTFSIPSPHELEKSTLVIKVYESRQFGGDMPAKLAANPILIKSPRFPYKYTVAVQVPKDREQPVEYSIQAVLNIDWYPHYADDGSTNEWIRKGDWLTTTAFHLHGFKAGQIEKDIYMVHYPLSKSDPQQVQSPQYHL